MSKSYCMNCQKEVGESIEKCECGSTYFIYGENFKFKDDTIVCVCGSKNFKTDMHMDLVHKSITNYACTTCNNQIGTENYRKKNSYL